MRIMTSIRLRVVLEKIRQVFQQIDSSLGEIEAMASK